MHVESLRFSNRMTRCNASVIAFAALLFRMIRSAADRGSSR